MPTSIFTGGGGGSPEFAFVSIPEIGNSDERDRYAITYNFKTGTYEVHRTDYVNSTYEYKNDFLKVHSYYYSDNVTITASGVYSIYIVKTEVVKKQAIESGTVYKTADYKYNSNSYTTVGSVVVLKW